MAVPELVILSAWKHHDADIVKYILIWLDMCYQYAYCSKYFSMINKILTKYSTGQYM